MIGEAFAMAVEVLREVATTRESELALTAAEAKAVLDALDKCGAVVEVEQ